MTEGAFRGVLEDILGTSRGSLRDQDTRDSLEAWSSVADAQIFTLITSEFGFDPDDELLGAESIGDLLSLLSARQAFED